MIAHHFPPEGAAGVHRPLRFVRALPAIGWRPVVISCDKLAYERYDPGLLALVPPGTDIRRVPAWDPWLALQAARMRRSEQQQAAQASSPREQRPAQDEARHRAIVRHVIRRVEAWCYHPDLAMRWIRPAVTETVKVCARTGADVIWATAGPVSALVVAHRASSRAGVPYVLDFRDAWTITYNAFEAIRPAWAIQRDRKAMARMLRGARAVVFRYPAEAECYWRAYPGALDPANVHIIPNGYDGAIHQFRLPTGDRCRILYTGTLISYRYDTLLEAVRELRRRDPARAARLFFVCVGEGGEQLREEVALHGLSDLFDIRGPVAHAEVNTLQCAAHALLVLGRPATLKGHELFASAKVFEYLKAGRPIIGVLPHDETRNVLTRVHVPTLADVDSQPQILDVLTRTVDAWLAGELGSLRPNSSACRVYSAEYQTAALVRAFDGAPAADRFLPGAVQVPPSLRSDVEARVRGTGTVTAQPSLYKTT
jgi:glycosyltransferase involved in cell wall biosynthesis